MEHKESALTRDKGKISSTDFDPTVSMLSANFVSKRYFF